MVIDLNGMKFICIYVLLIAITYIWYRGHKNINYKYYLLMLFIFYVLCVVKLAFFPLYMNWNGILSEMAAVKREETIYLQLVPFRTIIAMLNKPFWFVQIVGNIAFLLPLPVFIRFMYLEKNIKSLHMIRIGIFFSIGIELMQYIINVITCYPNRVVDIDDLILNSIGVLIGTYIAKRLENKNWVTMLVKKKQNPYTLNERIWQHEGGFVMKVAEKYISGLKEAYLNNGAKEQWEHFENVIHGVSEEDIKKLKAVYPDIPETLIQLLEYVDGTYWRQYKEEKIVFYFLGSDLQEYPYYLLSAGQMLENQQEAFDCYADFVDREFGDDIIDEKIIDDSHAMKWLHFSDCANNGGTSQLFIDFSPSEKGVSGQIVRYVHDPDEITVIADSFDEYLQMLMDNKYDFINEDTI